MQNIYPDNKQDKKELSLFELNESVKKVINSSFPKSYWITGEISELKINQKGHCYLELIEKDQESDNIIARARATIWASTFRLIKPYFETTTSHELSSGLKIMVKVDIEFHELYGYSLNINDIDPHYTLGDLARKKKETLLKLEKEGVLFMNRDLPFPAVPQKIAIISSDTAAGYRDFIHQLNNNSFGYKFYLKLFPAIMQGKEAEESIIVSLNRIYQYEDFFDVVVIIRGGGAQADLSCFNNYWLAYNVTQFPLPVLTGIGHEQDESIVDLVAHTKLKTPTAVAEYLISIINEFDNHLDSLLNSCIETTTTLIAEKKSDLNLVSKQFFPVIENILLKKDNELKILYKTFSNSTKNYISQQDYQINKHLLNTRYMVNNYITGKRQFISSLKDSVRAATNKYFTEEKHQFEIFEKSINYLKPENILKRGYSLTLKDGVIIKSANNLNKNDIIETILSKGKVESQVKNTS